MTVENGGFTLRFASNHPTLAALVSALNLMALERREGLYFSLMKEELINHDFPKDYCQS